MPRKYSGPLQPGKRSAYVPKKRANRRRRPRSAPSRIRGLNKTEKKQTRQIAKRAVNAGKESIYCKYWIDYDTHAATSLYAQPMIGATAILPNIYDPANGAATCITFQTGQFLTPNSVTLNSNMGGNCAFPLGGMKYLPAMLDSEHGIMGDYAHFQSGQISLAIYADPIEQYELNDSTFAPLDFRVLHVKIKGKYLQNDSTLYEKLFKDTENYEVGLSMVGSTKTLRHDSRINTDCVTVLHDIRFKLNNQTKPTTNQQMAIQGNTLAATANGGSASRPSYPAAKYLKLWTENPKKKIRWSDSTSATNDYEPVNWNFNEYVIITCVRDQTYNGSTGGVTPANNTSRMWRAAATGITKVKDM